ncbi:MAG: hypothetical protein HFG34_13240 [Eubacterium sp.]|nr:hypothetical protein [Eubacterium sp.]MCI8718836.1 hypothetical protein [Lachnospiraceae bacterium]
MINYKKYTILILAVPVFLIWGYLVWDINDRYPNPEEKILLAGEQARYQGILLTAGDIKIYSSAEFDALYDYSSGDEKIGTYIVIQAELKNDTEETIILSENQPLYWIAEVGYRCSNAVNIDTFQILNKDYTGMVLIEPGEVFKVELPYFIYSINASYDVIKKQDIRVVYSYYPTKNYILSKGV